MESPKTILKLIENHIEKEIIPKLPVINNVTYTTQVYNTSIGGNMFKKGTGYLSLLDIRIHHGTQDSVIPVFTSDEQFRINNTHYNNIQELADNIPKIVTSLIRRSNNRAKLFTQKDYDTQKEAYDKLISTLSEIGQELRLMNGDYIHDYEEGSMTAEDYYAVHTGTFTLIHHSNLVVKLKTIDWNSIKDYLTRQVTRPIAMESLKCVKIGTLVTCSHHGEAAVKGRDLDFYHRQGRRSTNSRAGSGQCSVAHKYVLATSFRLILNEELKRANEA
jgi:hypothetical protein